MQLLDSRELGLVEAIGSEENGGVRVPFEPCLVDEGGPADCDLANGVGQRGLGADRAEKSRPACRMSVTGL